MESKSERQFAVVTGASSGIGYELAKQFARNGFDVLITSEDGTLSEAAKSIAAEGGMTTEFRADLSTPEGVEELYGHLRSLNRPVDAVALNAGVGSGGDFARGTSLKDDLYVIDLNVRSTVHLAKLILRDMVERNEGKILFTSSIAATMPGTFNAVYNASKAFVQSFSQAIRNELKETGITITALMPGPTDTNFFERAGMEDTKVGAEKKDDPADVAKAGFEALMAGKDHVIAGSFSNKVQATMAHVLPDTTLAELHRKEAEPGTSEKVNRPEKVRQ